MDGAEERQRFAAPPAEGVVDGLRLELLDPADPDERRFLIQAEHPELRRALRDRRDEISLAGQVMSPRAHITMHEAVATQLWEDDPPEAWETAKRLLADGYDRHEVLHMLASILNDAIYGALREGRPHDPVRYRAALAALPASWEAMRDDGEAPHASRAERRAAGRRRHR